MIITGNPKEGVAQALHKIYPRATYCSRESGYDLTNTDHMFSSQMNVLNMIKL